MSAYLKYLAENARSPEGRAEALRLLRGGAVTGLDRPDPDAALWRAQGHAGQPGDPSYVHVQPEGATGTAGLTLHSRARTEFGGAEIGEVRAGRVVVSPLDGRAHVMGDMKRGGSGLDGDSQELRREEETDGDVEMEDDYVESLYE